MNNHNDNNNPNNNHNNPNINPDELTAEVGVLDLQLSDAAVGERLLTAQGLLQLAGGHEPLEELLCAVARGVPQDIIDAFPSLIIGQREIEGGRGRERETTTY